MEEGGGRGQGGGGAGAGDPLQGKAGGQVGLRGQARPARGQAGGNIKEKGRKEGEMRKGQLDTIKTVKYCQDS